VSEPVRRPFTRGSPGRQPALVRACSTICTDDPDDEAMTVTMRDRAGASLWSVDLEPR
jgi:hypothetical protein